MQVQLGSLTLPQFTGGAYGAGPYGGGAYGLGLGPGSGVLSLYVLAGTLSIVDAINQRTTCTLTVVDVLGANHFKQGMRLVVLDDSGNPLFGGFVADCIENRPGSSGNLLLHQITGMDYHYLADKRVVATAYVAGVTCGGVAQDLINNWLGSEGIYSIKNVLSANQSDVETDTSGFSINGVGTTLTRDTSQHWHGASSLKVVTPGSITNEGVFGTVAVSAFMTGQPYTFSVYLRGSGTVSIGFEQTSPLVRFGTSAIITLSSTWTRYSVTATLPASLVGSTLDFVIYTSAIEATTFWCDGLQWEPSGSGPTAWEVGQTSSIQPGPALSGTVTYNYKTAAYVLDQVAQFANYSWYIDPLRRLWFFSVATFTAPWTFDGTQPGTYDASGSNGTQVEHYNKNYRNSQYVLGATEVTSAQTEAHKGDGSTRAFPLGYPIHSQPSNINVNGGAAQTVGVQGQTGKQWYWQKGSNVLQQDSSGTVLAATDTLNVTYIGQYQVVAYSQDGNQVSIEQALEGIGSGIVEEATTDTKLTTAAQAFQEAAGLLGEYSSVGTILTFHTTKSGLVASQMLPVSLGAPHNISGNFLVEKVQIDYEPNGEVGVWWYAVTATQGPVSETWVQWFTRIVQPQASIVDVSSLGQQSSIVILQSGTVAWTWTLTGYTQIITYALPSPTSYPSPTTYPGSAGSHVPITWSKTNAGLNALAAALSSATNDPAEVTYIAWGTGTQGTPATATQLAAEVGRKQITSLVAGGAVGEEVITGQLGPQDANGVAITEVGMFAGPSASGAANSGTLMLYGLYSHTKAPTEAINIVADGTFS